MMKDRDMQDETQRARDASLARRLVELAWTDPAFAELLQKDPRQALGSLGMELPPGVEIDVRLQRRDPAARSRLIDDPVAGLKAYFGAMPDGPYRIEVVPQEPNRITLMLPAPPGEGEPTAADIDAAGRRIVDMLFTDGIGGYLIPDAALTWVLRDMRSMWSAAAAAAHEKVE